MTHPNIHRVLELSTGNISKETAAWIANELELEQTTTIYVSPLTIYPKTAHDGGVYGWWILTAEAMTDPEMWEEVPEDLQAVIKFAVEHNCTWIMFDGAAPILADLPTFKWE